MNREQAIEIQTYPPWQALVEEMNKLVTMHTNTLIDAEGPDIIRTQERIKAVRQCIRLPGLIAEREEE
jgi:hypothetical protein